MFLHYVRKNYFVKPVFLKQCLYVRGQCFLTKIMFLYDLGCQVTLIFFFFLIKSVITNSAYKYLFKLNLVIKSVMNFP